MGERRQGSGSQGRLIKELRLRTRQGRNVRRIGLWLAWATLPAGSVSVHAQDFPNGPIHIMVGAAPGGLIDLFARTYAGKLQERSGQPVLVENNSVATGTIGAGLVAKSAPNGYTLIMGHPANMTIWPIINPKLPYDPRKDFAPIALVGKAANLLLVAKGSPIHSVQELIAAAKEKPGSLTYASQGLGPIWLPSSSSLRPVLRRCTYHIEAPPRRSPNLMAGQVSFMIDTVPFNLSHVRSGTLRALAVADGVRSPVLPDVPTMAEAGVPNVEGGLWLALFAPAHTPPAVVKYLNEQAQEIFALPDVRQRLESQGLVLPKGSPDELAKFLAAEDKALAGRH